MVDRFYRRRMLAKMRRQGSELASSQPAVMDPMRPPKPPKPIAKIVPRADLQARADDATDWFLNNGGKITICPPQKAPD